MGFKLFTCCTLRRFKRSVKIQDSGKALIKHTGVTYTSMTARVMTSVATYLSVRPLRSKYLSCMRPSFRSAHEPLARFASTSCTSCKQHTRHHDVKQSLASIVMSTPAQSYRWQTANVCAFKQRTTFTHMYSVCDCASQYMYTARHLLYMY